MAKQIYIDENGNPIEVSGTINTAELLPISGNDPTDTKSYIDSKVKFTDITNQLTWQNSFALRAWGFLHAYQIGNMVIINVLGMYRASATTDWTTFLALPENIKPCYSSFAGGDNSASMVLGNNNALQITNYLANISVSGQIVCYLA